MLKQLKLCVESCHENWWRASIPWCSATTKATQGGIGAPVS